MNHHPLSGGLLPDDPDEGLILRASYLAPYSVPCGYCKARRGEDCLAKGKYTYAISFHRPRVAAVGRLTDIEKYRAFAEVRAEHVERRKAVEAEMAKPLTTEQLATRAAISAAFEEADRQFRAKERAAYARCSDPWIHNPECHCREGRPYVAPAPKPRLVRDVTDLAAVRARKAVQA